jgi:hypothetical protein
MSSFRDSIGGPLRRLLLTCLLLCATGGSAVAQVGLDRPGNDYLTFTVRNGDPAVCAQRCDRDRRCRAWSFAYPTASTPRAVCRLKRAVPPRVADACCVSGVRGSGVVMPRGRKTEFGIDRLGGDYRNFEVPPHPDGAQCAAACEGDNRCRAWSYVRPGYHGSSARCYLKSRVTRPRKRPCCISGVVR